MLSPAQLRGRDLLRRQFTQQGFLRWSGLGIHANGEGLTQRIGQATVDLARVLAFARGHFRGQQGRDQAVLVGAPHAAVLTQERGAGAFFAAKPQRTFEQAIGKPT